MRTFALLLLLVSCTSSRPHTISSPDGIPAPAAATLDGELESIRAAQNIPGLVAVVTMTTGVVAQGAAGVRKLGGTDRLTVNAAFHIGSVTKSFTATLAGILVDDAKLR